MLLRNIVRAYIKHHFVAIKVRSKFVEFEIFTKQLTLLIGSAVGGRLSTDLSVNQSMCKVK